MNAPPKPVDEGFAEEFLANNPEIDEALNELLAKMDELASDSDLLELFFGFRLPPSETEH